MNQDYCHCAKPIVIKGARGLGERCAKCLSWYDRKRWQRDPRVGLSAKLEAESAFLADAIIRVGKKAEQREAQEKALRESKKLRNKIKRWISSMFGKN
jgi:hypothetical protein